MLPQTARSYQGWDGRCISAIYFLSLITSLVVMERCARPSGRKPELTTEEKGWLQSVCARMCVCVCVVVGETDDYLWHTGSILLQKWS